MEDIQSLIAQGELADADARLSARLPLNPADTQLLLLAGVVKNRLGDGTAAADHLRACLEVDPDHALAMVALGRAERLQGQPVAAQAHFDVAVFLQPKLAGAHAVAGELAMFDGDADAATALALAELHEGADDPQAPIVLAALALQAGENGAALTHLKPLLAATKVNARVAQIAAAAYLLQGQPAQALEAVALVAPGTSGMPSALRSLQMRTLLNAQRKVEAEQIVRSYVSEHPQSAEAWSMAAETELMRAQFIHAIDAADRSLAIRPGSSHTVRLKAMAYLRAGKTQAAEELLGVQVAAYPADAKSWRMLLAAIIGPGNHAKAQQTAQRWVETMPEEADAHGDLAALMEFNGDLESAMLSARAALRLSSGHINALLIAARAELRIGRPGPVLARLDRVHPSTLDVQQKLARLALLARAADASGDQELAVSRWTEKQNSDPTLLDSGTVVAMDQIQVPAHETVIKPSDSMPVCFLVGLPGSGVQHVAAALSKISKICLLGDRFSHQARNDGLARPDWQALQEGLGEAQATMMRRRWIKPLQRINLPGKFSLLLDWLPHLDARMYAGIARAIPEARFLLVNRDPRDALLDWLAFSSPHRMRLPALADAGRWYANARGHLQFALDDQRAPVHQVSLEQLADPGAQDQLLQFLGLDTQPMEVDPPRTLGGLLAEFPSGHWQHYASEMEPAFRALGRV